MHIFFKKQTLDVTNSITPLCNHFSYNYYISQFFFTKTLNLYPSASRILVLNTFLLVHKFVIVLSKLIPKLLRNMLYIKTTT